MAKTIIEVPIRIGDKIFVVPTIDEFKSNVLNKKEENNKVVEQIVSSIQWWNNDEYFVFTNNNENKHSSTNQHNTWFVDEEWANWKLDRIKEKQWDANGNSNWR